MSSGGRLLEPEKLTILVWEALDHSSGNLPASCDAKLPTIEDGMTLDRSWYPVFNRYRSRWGEAVRDDESKVGKMSENERVRIID